MEETNNDIADANVVSLSEWKPKKECAVKPESMEDIMAQNKAKEDREKEERKKENESIKRRYRLCRKPTK